MRPVVNGGETVSDVVMAVSGDGVYDFGNGVHGTRDGDGTHGGASPTDAAPAKTVSFVILHNNSRRFWTHIVMK